jgi:hypothetical protein
MSNPDAREYETPCKLKQAADKTKTIMVDNVRQFNSYQNRGINNHYSAIHTN